MSIEPERAEDSTMTEAVVSSESGDNVPSNRELAEHLNQLQREKDAEIQQLREELEEERNKRKEAEDTIEFLKDSLWTLQDSVYGEYDTAFGETRIEEDGGLLPRIEEFEEVAQDAREVDQRITNEQKTRSFEDTKIRREINKLAEEVGVDLKDVDVSGEDKIQRLIAHGPDDIADRTYPVHRRAREVLIHATDWGNAVKDQFGKRITFTAPKVRQELERERGENLQSKQVRDVFEKIVELSEDSPRKARVGKTDDGNTKLMIHLQQEEM